MFEIKRQHTKRYYGRYVGGMDGYSLTSNYRSVPVPVEFLVIHCTEGFEAGDKAILSGSTDRRVSAHYYITRKAEIIEYVDPSTRAWHAGKSKYVLDGKLWQGFNDFSVGVELESRYVSDPVHGTSGYTDVQMEALIWLHLQLQERFPEIKDPRRTVGHEHISGYRGKTDPGPGFDWDAFRLAVFGKSSEPPPLSVTLDGVLLDEVLLLQDGKSYLPLRALAEALGLEVKWYGKQKRVELLSKAKDGSSA